MLFLIALGRMETEHFEKDFWEKFMRNIAYKIVKEKDGKLISMSGITCWEYLAVEYTPMVVAYPYMGKLFAFNTLDAACEYMDEYMDAFDEALQLWECEVINPKKCNRAINLSQVVKAFLPQRLCNEPNEFQRFWYKTKKCETTFVDTWQDTIVCDAIKLIRRIS